LSIIITHRIKILIVKDYKWWIIFTAVIIIVDYALTVYY